MSSPLLSNVSALSVHRNVNTIHNRRGKESALTAIRRVTQNTDQKKADMHQRMTAMERHLALMQQLEDEDEDEDDDDDDEQDDKLSCTLTSIVVSDKSDDEGEHDEHTICRNPIHVKHEQVSANRKSKHEGAVHDNDSKHI
uniref:Uncharacterized protein n=1 Tax=Lygus hesperus TaxID=30085 RepID=A0A0A9XPD8_LYGHE